MTRARSVEDVRRRLLRIPEAAEALGLSRATVYREIRAGRLHTVQVGPSEQTWRVPVDALNE